METQITPQCRADETLELLRRYLEQVHCTERVPFPTGDGFDFICIRDIVYFQASGNYTILHLQNGNGKKVLVTRSLKEMEELVAGYPFCRVHNGHMINLEHLVRYSRKEGGSVVMSDGTKLAVARGRREEFWGKVRDKR